MEADGQGSWWGSELLPATELNPQPGIKPCKEKASAWREGKNWNSWLSVVRIKYRTPAGGENLCSVLHWNNSMLTSCKHLSERILTSALEGTASRLLDGKTMYGFINWPLVYKMKGSSTNVGACSERGIFCELKWLQKSIWNNEYGTSECSSYTIVNSDCWGSTFSVLFSNLLKKCLV